jgi:CheY-like chemotaxis protein
MQEELRIVVVDDVEDAADALALLLRLEGCDVATAKDSFEAVALIEQIKPHAVLLDINMPGIDGYELATLIRHRYNDDIVLVAVTGSDPQLARVADTFAIVDHYFQKPVDAKALRDLLAGPGNASELRTHA